MPAIAALRLALTHMSGIGHRTRPWACAAQHQTESELHGPADVSSVGVAVALHLGLPIQSHGTQEYMKHGARTKPVFDHALAWADGMPQPGEKRGLGADLNLDEAGTSTDNEAHLPRNRLADGTVRGC